MKMKAIAILFIGVLCLQNIESKFNLNKILDKLNQDNEAKKHSTNAAARFSWNNCGPSTDPFVLNALDVSPDPLSLPGNLTFSGSVDVRTSLSGPLTLHLKLVKIVGPVKVEIPCVDKVGSCTYKDICALLPAPDNCPSIFKEQKIPCTCPFTSGTYDATNVQIEIDLPAKIPPGNYIVTANLESESLGHVACVQINLNLK